MKPTPAQILILQAAQLSTVASELLRLAAQLQEQRPQAPPTAAPAASGTTRAPAADLHTLWDMRRVCKETSLSAPTIWRLRQAGTFPDPVKLSENRKAYRAADILAWVAQRDSR